MARRWRRAVARARSILSVWLALSLLAAPGTGAAELLRDIGRHAGPGLARGAASAITGLLAAGSLGPTAALLSSPRSTSAAGGGGVWAWGNNEWGELGDGTSYTNRTTPVQVSGLVGMTAVAGGHSHSLGLKDDGTVWAWGHNGYGMLGDGTFTDRTTPVQVKGPAGVGFLTGVAAVAAGDHHSLALKSDATVWAWGWNGFGELGDGTITSRTTPVQVSGLTDVTAIAAGGRHSLALKSDGTVWAWGDNNPGQLGDGTYTNRLTPVQVTGPGGVGYLTDVAAIAGGNYHSLAVRRDGTAWAWGGMGYGELGDGACLTSRTPVQVAGPNGVGFLTEVTAVAGGKGDPPLHSLALRRDGTVWAFGANWFGGLGDGTTINRCSPVQVKGPGATGYLTGVVAIEAGDMFSLALKSDGTVWAWGANWYGQLGDGTTADRWTPVQTSGLTGVTDIAAGYYHSLAAGGQVTPPLVPLGTEKIGHPNVGTSRGSVNTQTGSFSYSHTDVAVPGRGPAPLFVRTYNSNDTRVIPLGPAWTHSYNMRLTDPGDGTGDVILVGPQGRSDRYTYAGGTFTPPPAIHTQLVRNLGGTYLATLQDQSTWTFDSSGRLSEVRDRFGNASTLTYNANGQLWLIGDPAGRGSLTLAYDTCFPGRLCSVSDWQSPEPRVVQYEYDTEGRLWKVTDREQMTRLEAARQKTVFGYESATPGRSHLLTTIADPLGNVAVTNTYDSDGRVSTQKDAAGLSSGAQTQYAYVDTGGARTTTVTYPKTSFEPEADPGGWRAVEEDTYDTRGWLTQRVAKPTSNPAEWATVQFGYDAAGNRNAVTDARGGTTNFCYDALGLVTRRVDPEPDAATPRPITHFAYQGYDLTQIVLPKGVALPAGASPTDCAATPTLDPDGLYTTFLTYDGTHQLTRVERRVRDTDTGAVQAAVTTYDYDPAHPGLVSAAVPPRGNTGPSPDYTYATTLSYFGTAAPTKAGLPRSVTDPLGNTTTFDYDSAGRRTSMVDASGNVAGANPPDHTWVYGYDNEDRVLRVEAPAPQPEVDTARLVTSFLYDAAGNLTERRDAAGQVTRYAHDARNQLRQVLQSSAAWTDGAPPATHVVRSAYAYDHLGNLTRVVRAQWDPGDRDPDDPTQPARNEERVTDYAYDGLDRLRKELQYPSWENEASPGAPLVAEATYDRNGNRRTVTDPLSQTTTLGYDALDRLTSVAYTNAAPGTSPTADVAYRYDAHGNRTEMSDGTGTTSYLYDELDRLLSVTSPGPTGPQTVGYRYDRDGNRREVRYPDGTAVTSTFDPAGRLQALLDWAGRSTSYQYRPDGGLRQTTNVNGTVADHAYDNALRLTQVWHRQDALSSNTISRQTYTLDRMGNRTQVEEVLAQLGAPAPIAALSTGDALLALDAGAPAAAPDGASVPEAAADDETAGLAAVEPAPHPAPSQPLTVDAAEGVEDQEEAPRAVLIALRHQVVGAPTPAATATAPATAATGGTATGTASPAPAVTASATAIPAASVAASASPTVPTAARATATHTATVTGASAAAAGTATSPAALTPGAAPLAPAARPATPAVHVVAAATPGAARTALPLVDQTQDAGQPYLYRAAARGYGVELFDRASGAASVRLEHLETGASLGFTLPGPATARTAAGATASARVGALTARWTSYTDRLKEDLVLASRPDGDQVVFAVQPRGLRFVPDTAGGYLAQSEDGATRFRLLAPTVHDARGRAGAATLTVTATAAVIRLDPAFLAGAAYPLTVDPTVVYTDSASDTTAYNNSPRLLQDAFGKLVLVSLGFFDSALRPLWSNDGGQTWTAGTQAGAVSALGQTWVLGADGTSLHLVCQCGGGIQYGRWTITRDASNNITAVTPPAGMLTLASGGQRPSLVLDRTGLPAVAWRAGTSGLRFLRAKGDPTVRANWVNAQGTSTSPDALGTQTVAAVSLARMPAGGAPGANDDALYLFWVEGGQLRWSRAQVAGVDYTAWSAPTAKAAAVASASSVATAPDSRNRGIVVAYQVGTYQYNVLRKQGADDSNAADIVLLGTAPAWGDHLSLAVDRGDLYVFYRNQPWLELASRRYVPELGWDAAETVLSTSPNTRYPTARQDAGGGQADVAWSNMFDVYHHRRAVSRPFVTALAASPPTFVPLAEQGTTLSYTLADDLSPTLTVTLRVYDGAGALVRTIVETQPNGARSLGWDGRGDAGAILPAGTYTVEVSATDGDGLAAPAQTASVALSRQAATAYGYDRLSRLTSVTTWSGPTTVAYDRAGNRKALVRDGTTTSYSYNRADWIAAAGGVAYQVDQNGNLRGRGADSFAYDQASRLTSALVGGATSAYAYDGDGRRASRTVGGSTMAYVHDVDADLPLLLDDGGRKYVWGLGLAYAVDTTGNVEVYHEDGLGSIRALTDGAGQVVQTYSTDAWGVSALTQGSRTQPFQFTGEPRDAETALVYLRARMYDPAVGRFMSRDPWAGSAVHPGSLNRYVYAQDNPVNESDPSGLDTERGKIAHRLIEFDYWLKHPTSTTEFAYRGPAATTKFIDIVHPLNRREAKFWEIKPEGHEAAGADQVRQRLRHCNRPGSPCGFALVPGTDYQGVEINFWIVRLRAWQDKENAGVILYRWDNPNFPLPVMFRPPNKSQREKAEAERRRSRDRVGAPRFSPAAVVEVWP